MNEALIFLSILGLFLLILFLKYIFEKNLKKVCALCIAVIVTWIIFLVLFKMQLFANKTMIVLLIGNSILGLVYFTEKKVQRTWLIFRVPFYLTLLFAGYILLEQKSSIETILVIIAVWSIAFFLFLYKKNMKIKSIIEKIIACCKNW